MTCCLPPASTPACFYPFCGTTRHAGRSRVQYGGVAWSQYARHVWKFDPYTTVVNASAWKTLLSFPLLYSALALLFALIYYATWRLYRECFIGFFTFQSAFMFSVETQATIGYGTRSVHMCWLPAHEVLAHSISALLLNTLYVGIIFAKLSTPRNRGRTILISDCATIARRNGTLKLMFRVGDMRARQVRPAVGPLEPGCALLPEAVPFCRG